MNEKNSTHLSRLKLGEILLTIQSGENPEKLYSDFSAKEMQELRNFLEKELQYLSSLKTGSPLPISEIKGKYEQIPNYYYKQACREPLEACINETCLASNPECFSRKMKTHIDVLIKLLIPYMEQP